VAKREFHDGAMGLAVPARLESPSERVIVPAKRRIQVADLIRDASIIRVLAARDFKVKYKQSILGPLWLVIQPVALLVAFVIAFRGVADVESSGVPYALFALVGLSVWAFFSAAATIGTASVVTNVSFVRFTPCPRHAFPIAAVIASLPSFGVAATAAVGVAVATGDLAARAVLLPLALVWLSVLTVGTVAISSALAVRYRDIPSALPFVLQVGVFLAPIGYSLPSLSSTIGVLVSLNPLTGIIEATRWMMLSGYQPSVEPILASLGATAVIALFGSWLFARLEPTMADLI
jgi:ABC-type polysaccharide/polyol phosphate export permease